GGRPGPRHPDPRRRGLLPAAAGAAQPAAHAGLGRPGDRAPPPAARAGRPALVLRALQPQAVRGVLRARGHRTGLPAGVRTLLSLARASDLQPVRAPESRAGEVRRRLSRPCSRSTSTPTTCRATGRTWRRSTATTASR